MLVLSLFFIQPSIPVDAPTLIHGGSFLLNSTFLENPHRHTQRCGFHGNSKSTQATMRVNPHPDQLHTLTMPPCRDAWGNTWPWYPKKLLI